MDPSPTPWRVLEDPPARGTVVADEALSGPTRAASIPRSVALIGGLAALLVAAAFAIAVGNGSSGSVGVEGAAPLGSLTATGPKVEASRYPAGSTGGRLLVVEIVGAIARPGVFHLPADSRVGDLVAAAGGYGPRVDTDRATHELNLAAPLRDGDQIRVPSRDDDATPSAHAVGGGGVTGATGRPAEPVHLNRATAAELDVLPGIGPVTAAKIIASREGQPFAAVTDLRERKLVGAKTFEQLKDLVTVP